MHQQQHNWAVKSLGYGLVAGKKVIYKSPQSKQKVHGVNAGHPVFKVLFKPVGSELKIIVIPVGYQKAR